MKLQTIYEDEESGSSDFNKDEYDVNMSTESSDDDDEDISPKPKINKEGALIRHYEAKINDLTKIIDNFKTKKKIQMETRQEDNMQPLELGQYNYINEEAVKSSRDDIDNMQALDSNSDGWYGLGTPPPSVGSAPTSVCAQIEENNRRLINELEKCKKRVMSGTRKRNTPSARKRNSPKTLRRNTPSARKRNTPKTQKHKSVTRSHWRPG
tara:strand:- start:23351 stop:23980 length:630 start_codon:yes stop_codon:yes gene_type:complete